MAVPDSTVIRIHGDPPGEAAVVPEVEAVEMPTEDFMRYREVVVLRGHKPTAPVPVVIAPDRDGE